MHLVYADHNATTPVHPEVAAAMSPFFAENFGNALSLHQFGQHARAAVEKARAQCAALLGCKPGQILFTSGASESNNLAVKGLAWARQDKGRHIISSTVEHSAVLNPCKWLATQGFEVTFLPVDATGRLDPQDLKAAIRPDTILISIMWANNELGTVEPMPEIAALANEAGVPLHTDAVQAVGKLPLNIEEVKVQALSISSHKFYGPKGAGLLYLEKGTIPVPLIHGGTHERGLRAGTENVPGIVGMGKAAELALRELATETPRLRVLTDRLWKGIQERIEGAHLNGHPRERLCNTLNVSFDGVEGEALVVHLDLEGVAVSTGAACSSGAVDPSHALMATGMPRERANSSIRISLGRTDTGADVERILEVLPAVVKKLRAILA
ncbi:MAG: cysteine desulfurase [Candidatus Omnitrophica bacterium]|nr:cysteine desulfurase [Candidatus Omnitrophota bacterium]